MKTFEQWDSEFTKNNTPFDKSDVKFAYESGAEEKEKEMLEFALYWEEIRDESPCNYRQDQIKEVYEFWKKNRLT